MASLQLTTRIRAPRERVFALATDVHNAAGRIPAIHRIEVLTEGPVRKGTRFKETRVMFGRPATEEMTVTEFEPPARFALGAESCGCRYHSEFHFAEQAGETEVRLTIQATPLTWFARVMGFLMRPLFKLMGKECGKDLAALKQLAEAVP